MPDLLLSFQPYVNNKVSKFQSEAIPYGAVMTVFLYSFPFES
jgi:hypothetical protein